MRERKNIFKTLVAFALVFAMVFTLTAPITAEAKTKKVTLPKQAFSTSLSVADGSAKVIGKGNYQIVTKKISKKNTFCEGYTKFTAPATKEYTFTFNKLRSNNGNRAVGHVSFYKPSVYNSIISVDNGKIKYKTSYTNSMGLASSKYNKEFRATNNIKITLQKDETVYIYYSFLSYKNKSISCKLNIK